MLAAGERLHDARGAVVLLHGRGATARDILPLGPELAQSGFAFVAPQAAGGTWYPNSFLAPLASNEPGLSSALEAVGAALRSITEAGIPLERTLLVGFSQGACLSLEYAARNPRRYGGLAGLSGGLIGPDTTPRDYEGTLAGTPVFLGCDVRDPHIPAERVRQTAAVLGRLGGDVTERLYEGLGHGVNEDELAFVRSMAAAVLRTASSRP